MKWGSHCCFYTVPFASSNLPHPEAHFLGLGLPVSFARLSSSCCCAHSGFAAIFSCCFHARKRLMLDCPTMLTGGGAVARAWNHSQVERQGGRRWPPDCVPL